MNIEIAVAARAILGIDPPERITAQTIGIEAKISLDPATNWQKACVIEQIAQQIDKSAQAHRPFLLERMAYIIANDLMSNFHAICSIAITVKKPDAIDDADHAYATLRLTRGMRR